MVVDPSTKFNTQLTIWSDKLEENVEANFDELLEAFGDDISYIEEVFRLFVDGTPGMGHQSSSIHVLRSVISRIDADQRKDKRFEVVYKPGDQKKGWTVNKLAILVPGFDPQKTSQEVTVDGVKVQFIPFANLDEVTPCKFGFTGGADEMPNLAEKLQTKYFLTLQPYRWADMEGSAPDCIYTDKPDKIGLGSLYEEDFAQRAYTYTVQPLSSGDWTKWETEGPQDQQKRAKLAHTLMENLGSALLCPTYGIRDKAPYERPPECVLLSLAAGIVAARDKYPGPAVIAILNDLSDEAFVNLNALLEGGMTPYERGALSVSELAVKAQVEDRMKIVKALDLDKKIDVWNTDDPATLKGYLEGLAQKQDAVVMFRLGAVPQQIFDNLFALGKLPLVFEGQTTATLALNLGIPYLHLPRPDSINPYPSTLLESENSGTVADELKGVTSAVLNALPKVAADKPFSKAVDQIAGFIRGTFGKQDEDLLGYFAEVKAFYGQPVNDKLVRGLVALQGVASGELLLAAAGPVQTLDQLYQAASENLKDGSLPLIPTVLATDRIAQTLKDFLGAGQVQLTGANVIPHKDVNGQIDQVTITGQVMAFDLDFTANLVFTSQLGHLAVAAGFTGDFTWTLDGVPWIGLESPGFALNVSDGKLPMTGKLFGTIKGTGMTVSIALPISNRWLISGSFDQPQSVSRFFSLAGGVDLVAVLPSPINQLAGFGLTGAQLIFDTKAKSLESIQFQMSTAKPWPLFGKLQIDAITVNLAILQPAARDRRFIATFGGAFRLGTGLDAGVIAVSATVPQFKLQGYLQSGEIKIADLLTLFLPDTTLDLPSAPSIDGFGFTYDPAAGDYSVRTHLNINWPIKVNGTELFTIADVGFAVTGDTSGPTGSLFGSVALGPQSEPAKQVVVQLSAGYQGAEQGWLFSGVQESGSIKIGDLVKTYVGWDTGYSFGVTGLGAQLAPTTGAFSVTGRTDGDWQTPIDGLTVAGAITLSHAAEGFSGTFATDLKYHGMDLKLGYDFNPKAQCFSIQWDDFARATLAQQQVQSDPNKHWVATVNLTGVTLGSIIERFVSLATGSKFGLSAPWNLLDDVSLDGFSLQFDFTSTKVSLTVPLNWMDLGFAKFKSVSVTYDPTGPSRAVNVEVSGQFLWLQKDTLGWDATKPETTPPPPGAGSKYLDLRLLALGQHVTVPGYQNWDSVQKAIEELRGLSVPKPGNIPVGAAASGGAAQPIYEPNSSWLIASDFGILKVDDAGQQQAAQAAASAMEGAVVAAPPSAVMTAPKKPTYFLSLSVIFNDPNLYALRMALDGPAAKIFKGLDFQIMYRRISDTVGVYQTELKLPDAMRELSVGAYSITLPVFAIAVYTNGDFKVDVGFPWNQDFARSFTVQGIVYPGIPLLGSGGFYFGKLSSATSNQVPSNPAKGQFNPVIIFGVGLQVGVGKYIEKGILRAGFSITVLGILEGVIARWNPNTAPAPVPVSNQLQGDYYFWLQGTAGIQGKLFGAVDFAVVKAAVDVTLTLLAQLTFESYQPIPISVIAAVDIALALEINLWLFKVTLHFSFSARIKETFTITNPQRPEEAPWYNPNRSLQAAKLQRRLRALAAPQLLLTAGDLTPLWENLLAASTPQNLTVYFVPALTVSGDGATSLGQQRPAYVATLFVESVNPQADRTETAADTSFELLAKQVFRWMVAAMAGGSQPLSAAEVDQLVVTDDQLAQIMTYLSKSGAMPIPVEKIAEFMAGQFRVKVSSPTGAGSADTAFFPMVPDLQLEVPAYGGAPGLSYKFADFNALSDKYLADLKSYFDRLAVQVEDEMKQQAKLKGAALSTEPGPSMATYVWGDYFLLMARQMVQGARDALRNFQYQPRQGQQVGQIVDWVNQTGDLQGDHAYTLADLFEANSAHPLNPGKLLTVTGLTYQVVSSDTLTSIAQAYAKLAKLGPAEIVGANLDVPDLLVNGVMVTYPGTNGHQVVPGDTFRTVATELGVQPDQLASGSNLANTAGLLRTLAVLSLPALSCTTAEGDTLSSVAQAFSLPVTALAEGNEQVVDLFAIGTAEEERYLNLPHLPQFQVAELIGEIQRSLGIQHLSGMATRYFLHGLRLPTAGITPKQPCMCGQGAGQLAPECGLFALTGQQFPIPSLDPQQPFSFSLTNPNGLTWVDLGDAEEGQ